jgi:hypothetical protein
MNFWFLGPFSKKNCTIVNKSNYDTRNISHPPLNINCVDHVIWTGRRMLKLVLSAKYLLLLSFLPVTETIFGISGFFSVSQGQEMKDLPASRGLMAT